MLSPPKRMGSSGTHLQTGGRFDATRQPSRLLSETLLFSWKPVSRAVKMAHGRCSPKAGRPVPSQSLLSPSKLRGRWAAGWRCSLGPAVPRLCGSDVSGRVSETCVGSPCSLTHSAETPSPVRVLVQLPHVEAAASLPRRRGIVRPASLLLHSRTPRCCVLSSLCSAPCPNPRFCHSAS